MTWPKRDRRRRTSLIALRIYLLERRVFARTAIKSFFIISCELDVRRQTPCAILPRIQRTVQTDYTCMDDAEVKHEESFH